MDPWSGSHTGTVVHGIPPGCSVLWLDLSEFDWPMLLVSDGQTVALYGLHHDPGGLRADKWIEAEAEIGPQVFSLSRNPLFGDDMLPLTDPNSPLKREQHLLSYDPDSGLAKIAVVRLHDAEIRVKVLECLSNCWPRHLKVSVYPSVSNNRPGRIVRHLPSSGFFDILDYRPERQFWLWEDLNRIRAEAMPCG